MTTARDIITLALKESGVVGVGQTPLSEDMNDSFTLLKQMWAQWQKRRWMVPALEDIQMPGNGEKSNTIGTGGYWDIQRPVDIKGAYFLQTTQVGGSPFSFALRKIFSYEDYIRITLKELTTWPMAFFYDAAWPLGNVFVWPIPNAQYEIHLLVEKQLVFTGISTGSITTGGTLYVDGAYTDVPLTGGRGSGATANIIVTLGIVTDVQIVLAGRDYVLGDLLSASNVNLGGVGSGFTWTITALDNNLDYEFELPEEYLEATHYNLAVRLISMYQVSNPSPQTGVLAKVSLKTIKTANTQIPSLVMPRALRNNKGQMGFGYYLYNPDGY